MMKLCIVVAVCLLFVVVPSHTVTATPHKNRMPDVQWQSPVIGVFSWVYGNSGSESLEASYVKWVESAGGRVVRIASTQWSESQYDDIFPKLNGLLLPGGGAEVSEGIEYMLNKALQANKKGDYFPVWGTCLGFQLVSMVYSGNQSILTGTDSYNISMPILETHHTPDSRLFQSNPAMLQNMLQNNITMNNHHWSLSPRAFRNNPVLQSEFQITSTNVDVNGKPFISSFQHATLPIYAVQYHPEKNNFEVGMLNSGYFYEAINHNLMAVEMSQGHANFFVQECRRSKHTWDSGKALNKALIYNYRTTNQDQPSFVETYDFPI